MSYVVRLDHDQVVSLTCLREFATRWKEMCGDWLSDEGAVRLQQAIDDLDTILFSAEQENKLPDLHSVSVSSTAYDTEREALARRAEARRERVKYSGYEPSESGRLLLKNAFERALEEGWQGVYPGMCVDRELCRGRSSCPRDRSCCE